MDNRFWFTWIFLFSFETTQIASHHFDKPKQFPPNPNILQWLYIYSPWLMTPTLSCSFTLFFRCQKIHLWSFTPSAKNGRNAPKNQASRWRCLPPGSCSNVSATGRMTIWHIYIPGLHPKMLESRKSRLQNVTDLSFRYVWWCFRMAYGVFPGCLRLLNRHTRSPLAPADSQCGTATWPRCRTRKHLVLAPKWSILASTWLSVFLQVSDGLNCKSKSQLKIAEDFFSPSNKNNSEAPYCSEALRCTNFEAAAVDTNLCEKPWAHRFWCTATMCQAILGYLWLLANY